MEPTELSAQERTLLFHRLLNHLDASNRMVVEVADSRWQVAVTKFRQGLKDQGLRRAIGQYLAGLFLSKDEAVTDFVRDVNILGKKQDVLVSWASSAQALKEELLVIQSCLNAGGMLDDRQPLDFDFGADVSAFQKSLGASVHYDNSTRKVEVSGNVDTAQLLAGILSTHLSGSISGRFGFTLRKNHLKNDPRLSMMAGILTLEALAGEGGFTCQKLSSLMELLTRAPGQEQYIEMVKSEIDPVEPYLRSIFDILKPEIERLAKIRRTFLVENVQRTMDGIADCLFEQQNFAGAFAGLKVLREVFELQNLHDPQAQSIWTLLSAAVYLGGQVAAIKSLLPDTAPAPNPSPDLSYRVRP